MKDSKSATMAHLTIYPNISHNIIILVVVYRNCTLKQLKDLTKKKQITILSYSVETFFLSFLPCNTSPSMPPWPTVPFLCPNLFISFFFSFGFQHDNFPISVFFYIFIFLISLGRPPWLTPLFSSSFFH